MYTQFSLHHCSHTLTPSQSVLSAKQRELDECVGRVRDLEGLLRVAQRQSDKAAMLNMKKVWASIPVHLTVIGCSFEMPTCKVQCRCTMFAVHLYIQN